eukprot:TRINITY_DN24170_c0_g1_i1.p1 TRINITY_DN24170_c0_g1~~TRINITY_DN24170_c0_g1_i1.p1  ORF type:complete len:342 (-),score=38.32 TRINITY_DN24170_c0_g1_i1:91-1116(-)
MRRSFAVSAAWLFLCPARPALCSHDFMVMGDWGGVPVWPYETPGQHHVARELGKVAGEVGAGYTVVLGDNFYLTGVKSEDDPRFNETFEFVFSSDHLKNAKHFRVLAGNHDHYGNCSAEIAYTKRSVRWHFPSLYYDFIERTDDGQSVHHVMIDTILLAGQSMDSYGKDLPGSAYPGPSDEELANKQWKWIESTLSTSKADYLVVAGHYPIWSICEHGPTNFLVERLKPILEAANVSVYLAGHDHCAQFFDEGRGVKYHGIGAGVVINPSMRHLNAVPPGSLKWHLKAGILGYLEGAFAHVSINKTGLVVSHYGSDGKKLFEAEAVPPRRFNGKSDMNVLI